MQVGVFAVHGAARVAVRIDRDVAGGMVAAGLGGALLQIGDGRGAGLVWGGVVFDFSEAYSWRGAV